MMDKKPNPADFSVNEQTGQYTAEFEVTGTVTVNIRAESLYEAKALAEKMRFDDGFEHELDDIDDIGSPRVRPMSRMFRVIRDGQVMQVSRLEAGDLPRQPDERGF